jgi:uncharacterized protein (TIGR02271 family)
MHTYTAIYDNRQDAEAAQQQLKSLGIIEADGMNLADQNTTGFQADRSADNKGFWGSLKGGVAAEDRPVYEESVRQGCFLLTVNVDDENADRVEDLLEKTNAVDIDEREQQYRQTGLIPPTDMRADQTSMGRTEGLSQAGRTQGLNQQTTGDQSIPIVQEDIKVGKRQVERGGVRVRSYIVETPVHEQVTLRDEHVEVERRPVNQALNAGQIGDDMLRERTIELTETSEEAVVAKEARVVEEVVVHKTVGEHVETIDDTVRRTEVEVDRTPGMNDTNRR